MKRLATMSCLLTAMLISTSASAQFIRDAFFDVFTDLPDVAPPYPSNVRITIVGSNFGGSFQPLQQSEISVRDFDMDGLPDVPATLMSGGGGAGGQPPAIDSFFDVFVDLDLPANGLTGRKISDIRIVHPPGQPPGTWRLVPIDPGAPPGSVDSFFDVFVDLSFFDIEYRVADDSGEIMYHVHGMSPSGRMSFFDVFVELPNPGSIDSFFDVFVDFQMCCDDDNDGLSELRMTTTGTIESNPVPVERTTWSRIKNLLN